jgi:hypothetical protein
MKKKMKKGGNLEPKSSVELRNFWKKALLDRYAEPEVPDGVRRLNPDLTSPLCRSVGPHSRT